jgi:hypothetical protein
MTELELFVDAAMPHEAGHILVGRVLGYPIYGLDHIVNVSLENKLVPGNFATVTVKPTNPGDFDLVPQEVRNAYAEMTAGGLAGNWVSKTSVTEHGIEVDRADLRMVSNESLETVAERSRKVIDEHLTEFEKLRAAIKASYDAFLIGSRFSAGRHELLSAAELEAICPQNKSLFPPKAYR